MSVILQPQVAFPLVRQVGNHTDTATYYVRAVIRNAEGSTIDTVNLASQGSQRYQSTWQVPADPTGRGIYVSIITSVYTDSGYTTKSENYADEENTYLIFDRVLPAMRGSGAGGLDSRTVRRIIAEELEKVKQEPEPVQVAEQEPAQWGEVLANIGYLAEELSKVPKVHVDLSPTLAAIKDKPVTVVDLTPVLKSIEDSVSSLHEKVSEVQGEKKLEYTELTDFLEHVHDSLAEVTKETISDGFKNMELVTTQTVMHTKENSSDFDITKYTT